MQSAEDRDTRWDRLGVGPRDVLIVGVGLLREAARVGLRAVRTLPGTGRCTRRSAPAASCGAPRHITKAL